MYKNNSICVVIPAYHEELLIGKVLDTIPDFIDHVCVIDDFSLDKTVSIVKEHIKKNPKKFSLIEHTQNQGVGAAIASGYKKARDENYDIAVVMAGDAQMDPDELPLIIDPIIEEKYDYTKGNRLFSGDAWNMIPKVRYLGNAALSLLTKIASGYWHIADSQSGYTGINSKALKLIDWDKMYKRYGQPNDLLVRLNLYDLRVKDVHIKPIYGVGERSGIRPLRMIPGLAWLITKLFFYRMLHKYIIRDFHPLIFFYFLGLLFFPLGFMIGIYLLYLRLFIGPVADTSALFSALFMITGLQFLLFAMWFDMEANIHLK